MDNKQEVVVMLIIVELMQENQVKHKVVLLLRNSIVEMNIRLDMVIVVEADLIVQQDILIFIVQKIVVEYFGINIIAYVEKIIGLIV